MRSEFRRPVHERDAWSGLNKRQVDELIDSIIDRELRPRESRTVHYERDRADHIPLAWLPEAGRLDRWSLYCALDREYRDHASDAPWIDVGGEA